MSVQNLNVTLTLVCDVSIAGEKTGFAAASAFSFRCTDRTAGATCNKWRADLIAEKRFIFNHTKTPVLYLMKYFVTILIQLAKL